MQLALAWQVSDGFALLAGGEVQGILPRTVTTSDHDLGNGRYSLVVAAFTERIAAYRADGVLAE